MRPALALLLGACCLAAPAGSAHADLFSIAFEAHGGGAAGKGLGGDHQDDAFHAGVAGGTYGGKLGVEILFVDVWVEHDQYVDADGLLGTWTELMTGLDLDLDIGGNKGGWEDRKTGEYHGGFSSGYAELGGGVGFGLGTGQQVDPPLDNSEVTDKGFVAEGRIRAGWRLTPSWSLGVTVPVQLSYLIKSGAGATANDLSTHYTELSIAGLLALRCKLKL